MACLKDMTMEDSEKLKEAYMAKDGKVEVIKDPFNHTFNGYATEFSKTFTTLEEAQEQLDKKNN